MDTPLQDLSPESQSTLRGITEYGLKLARTVHRENPDKANWTNTEVMEAVMLELCADDPDFTLVCREPSTGRLIFRVHNVNFQIEHTPGKFSFVYVNYIPHLS
jgi:hypothetical protein